ncbi:MAG: hypothetical protein HC915_16310, partial [Anaerolineae bacterium]|nr:hypothetical protein [Anaerolineae bacterium]
MRQKKAALGRITLLLLIAAGLRISGLDEAPPGLQVDEIFNAQDAARLAEDGDLRLFYPLNQGREGGLIWLMGLTHAVLGPNWVMIKVPGIALGLLSVALGYRWLRDWRGERAALRFGRQVLAEHRNGVLGVRPVDVVLVQVLRDADRDLLELDALRHRSSPVAADRAKRRLDLVDERVHVLLAVRLEL